MRSGKRQRPHSARGFTLLVILIAIALLGIGLAAIGTVWATVAQREREAQLLFVGHAYRDAIASYSSSGPAANQLPRELQDLVQDERQPLPRRHLRQIYPDPFTGQADWELLRDPDGAIYGVVSRSRLAPFKHAHFADDDEGFESAKCYCEWRFEFKPGQRPTHASVSRRSSM
jgi:type II secretory pathway pseudopilin PulG